MTRLSQKQYERRGLAAVTLYSGFMLLAWPLLHTVASFPLKVLLALTPILPMIYLISLLARRIGSSDEFEQRTHLIALGVATAVVSALGLLGGFLSVAGVLNLDGSILIWVFPVVMFSYSGARWYVLRRYGASALCSEEKSAAFYLRFALVGVVVIAIAAMSPRGLEGYRLGFIYGSGAGCAGGGLLMALLHWYRHRYRGE